MAARLLGQFGDGIFQASLAGAVLFNPERQAGAADVAAGFAVLLLPYSLIGPFAGILLDRWWRQRILLLANLARAAGLALFALGLAQGLAGVGFYAAALVLISTARFVLAALGAALPRVVPARELVTANAAVTTAGTVAAALGGGLAVGVRSLLGAGDRDYALAAALGVVPYVAAALAAAGFARDRLGPTAAERHHRPTAADALADLRAGLAHVRQRPLVRRALTVVGIQRLGFGVTSVCVVLLYRNRFVDDGLFPAGLAGLSQVVAMLAAGGALAAVVTPVGFRRIGPVGWPASVLAVSGLVELATVLPYRQPPLLVGSLLLGFAAQSVKVSVDTLVQQGVDDAHRGRVFALYDALFNLALVVAAVLVATALPPDGRSPVAVVSVAVGYVVTAAAWVAVSRRGAPTPGPGS